MSYAGLLNQTCTIERFTASGADAAGQPTGSWASTTAVRCRLDDHPDEKLTSGASHDDRTVAFAASPKLFLVRGTDIKPGDRVSSVTHRNGVVLSAGPFAVTGVSDASGAYRHVEATLGKS